MKKKYVEPSFIVVEIESAVMNIAGSGEGNPEDRADSRHSSVVFFDDEEEE